MRLLPVAVFGLVAIAAPAAAQGEPLEPTLDIQPAYLTGEGSDGISYVTLIGTLEAPWALSFPSAAAAAKELATNNGTLTWSLECTEPITMEETTTKVEFVPAEADYEGKAELTVHADPTALGGTSVPCDLTAVFAGAAAQAMDTAPTPLIVEFHGELTATTPTPSRQAGPQKQIPYPIEVTNNGNAPTLVTFQLAEQPSGRWNALVPDAMVIEPGETETAILTVATPFRNGYVKGHTDITVLIHGAFAEDPDQVGGSTSVELAAKVRGLYIPGPQLPLLALALLAVAGVRARRT